ncbi:hypothetical protein LCGC14_2445310 [marine sediment metagenome]|uniref:Uncharacterized protein n=1 Tax=marine sediment metagenome TaxID=412755 RepID=A0A0F9C581_9ZZZZ
MPQRAPLAYSIISPCSVGLSYHNHNSTIRLVMGIVAIKPARVGNFRPICEQNTIIATDIAIFIMN